MTDASGNVVEFNTDGVFQGRHMLEYFTSLYTYKIQMPRLREHRRNVQGRDGLDWIRGM